MGDDKNDIIMSPQFQSGNIIDCKRVGQYVLS